MDALLDNSVLKLLSAATVGAVFIPSLLQVLTGKESTEFSPMPAETTEPQSPSTAPPTTGRTIKKNLLFEGVQLPDYVDFSDRVEDYFSIQGTTPAALDEYKKRISFIQAIGGRNKTFDAFESAHNFFVNFAINGSSSLPNQRDPNASSSLPEGFMHFGNNDNLGNIKYFYTNNPLFAVSLRDHPDGGYEIDPYGKAGPTYFSRLLSGIDKKVIRVYARLDKDMNLIPESLQLLKEGKPISEEEASKYVTSDGKFAINRAAAALLFQGVFFAECIHATTHVLHYLMTTGLAHATENTPLAAWAVPQVQNIYHTFDAVETLLLSEGGLLTGNTGQSFFVADGNNTLRVCREMLLEWGSFKSASDYVEKFIGKNIPIGMREGKLLPQFLKHAALMESYGCELDAAVTADGVESHAKINSELSKYMRSTGDGVSSVDNIKNWAELMAITGVLHGSTLSMTRLFCTPSLIAERFPENSVYNDGDVGIVITALGTIVGAKEDFRVFSSTLPSPVSFNVNRVLTKYDALAADLKAKYFIEITQNVEEFKKFGWILTDHGPNFVDGKILTIATYF